MFLKRKGQGYAAALVECKHGGHRRRCGKLWTRVISVACFAMIAALLMTQDATAERRDDTTTAQDSISAGYNHTIGLKADGTVLAVGDNWGNQCGVNSWHNIAAVSAGNGHTVGLKSDGTVVAVGETWKGACNVGSWRDIVAVSAGGFHTVGLKADGTVLATGRNLTYGNSYEDTYCGQCDISDWRNIWAIAAGDTHTVGLKTDGTVVAVGSNEYGQCNISGWRDIVAISAKYNHTVGLKSGGTVVAIGSNLCGQCDVDGWRDVVAVSTGRDHTVGLKSDGSVVAVGSNLHGQCDVSGWRDIVAISAGRLFTIGLKSNGTVVAVGDNSSGQCSVSSWKDMNLPAAKQPTVVHPAKRPTEAAKPVIIGKSDFDVESTFGYTKAWEIRDYFGTECLVTSLAFLDNDTFCCCIGYRFSEWSAAFKGTYEVNGDEITLRYTWNGKEMENSYQIRWEEQIMKLTSDIGLNLVHQAGSKYHFEEDSDFTADGLLYQVELFALPSQEWDGDGEAAKPRRIKQIDQNFNEEELRAICDSLGVPRDLDVQITQGKPYYWEAGEIYRTEIEIYHNGEMIAAALVNSRTGELAGAIYMYSDSHLG